MITTENFWQNSENEKAKLIKISFENGAYASFTNYGAALVALAVPDKYDVITDVVLGFDSVEGYIAQDAYIGAVVGRCANRIENASFTLNEKTYKLYANDGANHLHGGKKGFDKYYYDYEIKDEAVSFYRVSPDGEEGYPGKLEYKITYGFNGSALMITYEGVCDKDTYFNPSMHAYFNLNGCGDIKKHLLKIYGEEVTKTRSDNIPTGKIIKTVNTAFDFINFTPVGERLTDKALASTKGYDHNYVLRGEKFHSAAELVSEKSGIKLKIFTDMPGIQVYSGNYLSALSGKRGSVYDAYAGIALETQFYPNTPNMPDFPQCLLKADTPFKSATLYKLSLITQDSAKGFN